MNLLIFCLFSFYIFRYMLRMPYTVPVQPHMQAMHMSLPQSGENSVTPPPPPQKPPSVYQFLVAHFFTSIQDSQLADWAARAFILLGGDVKISAHATSPGSPFVVNSPFIQRAWLSIDSDIYVWTYEDG